jgi:CheY-like chemotaxis protein
MNILMIEDAPEVFEVTSQLLFKVDRDAKVIDAVLMAGNLEAALDFLETLRRDGQPLAILCDGQFPSHPNSRFTFPNWQSIFAIAVKMRARFVLYSGDERCLAEARRLGIAALSKPTSIKEIYQALVRQW